MECTCLNMEQHALHIQHYRQMKRYHPARMEKHMGDLCLLTGQLQNASRWYRVASEQLKSQKDWLWVGGAYEGLSVTAMMTKECEQVLGQKAQGVGTPFLKLISKVGVVCRCWVGVAIACVIRAVKNFRTILSVEDVCVCLCLNLGQSSD